MTPAEVVQRARSAIGRATAYKLGAGGNKPGSPQPGNILGECDCSGFAAWCLGVARKTDNPWYAQQDGGWLETSAIYRDCATSYGIFDGVEWREAQPGDLLVWPDHKDPAGVQHQGHVGIVSEVGPEGPTQVVHCSHGNWVASGDAVAETATLIFQQHGARAARCAWVKEDIIS